MNTFKKTAVAIVAAVCVSVLALGMSATLGIPLGIDWAAYRPAALHLLAGQSPYSDGFYNPPWVLLPLLPLALLPEYIGALAMFVANLLAFAFTFARMKIHPALMAILLLASLQNSIYGNIEGLVSLGFILPPQVGLFFVMAKPQIGIGVAVLWAVEAWRKGGVKLVIQTFSPAIIAYLISFLLYGFWMQSTPVNAHWNGSIFPYGVPFGLALIVYSIWKRRQGGAIASGVLLSPYVHKYISWSFLGIGIASMISDKFRKE